MQNSVSDRGYFGIPKHALKGRSVERSHRSSSSARNARAIFTTLDPFRDIWGFHCSPSRPANEWGSVTRLVISVSPLASAADF
jgi:hypothetical protein